VSCKWDACSQGNYGYCFNDIHYFAVPASDLNMAVRINAMASMNMAVRINAMASTAVGDFLLIDYDRNADGSWFGCLYSNCRPVISFARAG
jgi:hypothetical protein